MGAATANRLTAGDANGGIGLETQQDLFRQLLERERAPVTVFDKINDPLAFVEQFGRALAHAGVGGVKNEAEGKCLAFACLCEKKNPFEITRVYHMMDGKLTKKAEVMLIDFNEAGGEHTWIATGDDGIKAVLELKWNSKRLVSDFSIDDAKTDGLVDRRGSRYAKGGKATGEMLRARCISRGLKMLAPKFTSGILTTEEAEDLRVETQAAAASAPRQSPEEIEARRNELQAIANLSNAVAATQPAPEKSWAQQQVDANLATGMQSATEAAPTAQTAPTAAAIAGLSAVELDRAALEPVIAEILSVSATLGFANREAVEKAIGASNPGFKGLDSLGLSGAEKLLAGLKECAASGAGKK